ncbi:MAG: hypothetical protein I4O51_10890 [Flavobacterium micromati]|nr:hypothetical protein [Flavobacterium micromati]
MNKYFSMILSIVFSCVYSQNVTVVDTIKSNINVQYYRVDVSNGYASEAALQASYLPKSSSFALFFEVPNYDVRYKTTTADYAIIKMEDKEIRLKNLAEFDANGLIQKFVFEVSKDTIQKLVNEEFKKITFYFAPNEDFIIQQLAKEKNLNPQYKEFISQNAKKTVETTIWRPNKRKLQELKLWLEKF